MNQEALGKIRNVSKFTARSEAFAIKINKSMCSDWVLFPESTGAIETHQPIRLHKKFDNHNQYTFASTYIGNRTISGHSTLGYFDFYSR